ncbi:pyruvate dehydrogenase E1 component alpha subunit [Crossiella equi]|uniref:Pyruvate dehydrogenase E1 component alpha subunit n=1 Tax=Crossiella equi TaxID=130796 RepID=A0ABS5AMQ2_9PSEU|nr:pyruvate dehydrogenase (acetyl-transferring) E1 component subunit alpha [Crossiella equi]MBP2477841.1 pyruvate dehydrogenase E1 component alpha subunit [Crossiella equi]
MTVITDQMVQLLTPTGERVPHPVYDALIADIDGEALRGLYEDLVVVRRIDAEGTALQRQGQLGLWPPLLGQEAAQIGSARALHREDFVFPSYREHAVAYCRGVKPADVFGMWRGTSLSCWDPYDINMAIPAIIIGAQGLHATGYALGLKRDGVEAAAVAYFGDGATSQGDIAEALGFSAAYQAPAIFFCQNNQWAISEPVGLQTQVPIYQRAAGYGMPGIQVDGNDVLAVLAVTRWALQRAREGSGPALIEAVTYRMGPHTTADDPTRYRPTGELEEWRDRDPLARMLALLEREGLADEAFLEGVRVKADEVAAGLRAGCLALEDPAPMSLFDNVYATEHPLVEEERAQYAAYLDGFEGSN